MCIRDSARLFASRVGGALAVLCPFPAAALFWHDRRACRAAIYARGVSSLKLVLCRCAALTAAMLLPVTVMALTLTCVAAMDYGLASIDLLAYGKYALLWLLPTILPVSYTHLAVYKRQGLVRRRRGRGLSGKGRLRARRARAAGEEGI